MLRHYANYIANLHVMAAAARAPVVDDVDLLRLRHDPGSPGAGSESGAAGPGLGGGLAALHSLLLVGGPARNSAAAALLRGDPRGHAVSFLSGGGGRGTGGTGGTGVGYFTSSFIVGGCTFRGGDGAGMVVAVGAAGGGVHTIVAGTDPAGERDAVVLLATPTIPPMTRPPYTNHAPDVTVTTAAARLRGAGGLAVAGTWGAGAGAGGGGGGGGGWGWEPRAGFSVCE